MARRPKITNINEAAAPQQEEASGDRPSSVIEWPRVLLCPFCKTRQMSSAAKEIDNSKSSRACIKCGAAISPMNAAPAMAPEPPPGAVTSIDEPPPDAKQSGNPLATSVTKPTTSKRSTTDAAPNPDDVGETVSATWGEELYTPQQFFSFRVGPFTRTTKIREGETAVAAKRRIHTELRQMADDERAEKLKIFLDTMGYLFKTVKGGDK